MNRRSLAVALSLSMLVATAANAQRILAPARIVDGDPVPVRVKGLSVGAKVVVVAERVGARRLRASARFMVGASGTVDLRRDAPISGDYSGRDAAGLFWSMRPVEEQAPTAARPRGIHLSVLQGDRTLAECDIEVLSYEPGLLETPVEGLVGARLYHRASKGKLPVAILLGGSEGGDAFGAEMTHYVADQGYAALVVPYYAPSWVARPAFTGLPADFADIPVDRLEDVRRWIAARPELDARRIVVIGVSKGGEFAMLAAAHFPWLRAVVGIVPSDVVWEGWGPSVVADDSRSSFSWRGRPLPWVPYKGLREVLTSLQAGGSARMADAHADGRAANPLRVGPASIGVEEFKGPMMVVGGGRDATWPSASMVANIASRRAASHRRTVALIFPLAGHDLSRGGWGSLRARGDDGTAEATAHAQVVTRLRLTKFLRSIR